MAVEIETKKKIKEIENKVGTKFLKNTLFVKDFKNGGKTHLQF